MAILAVTSHREMERIAGIAWETRDYRICLANMTTEGFDAESDVSDWDSVEITDSAYAQETGTVAAGSYDSTTDLRYEIPIITASFSADIAGSGYTATHYYMVLNDSGVDDPNILQLGTFQPALTFAPGQTQTIQIQLVIDD